MKNDEIIDRIDARSPDKYMKSALRMSIETLRNIQASVVPTSQIYFDISATLDNIGQAFGIGTKYDRPCITIEMRKHFPCPFSEEEPPLRG